MVRKKTRKENLEKNIILIIVVDMVLTKKSVKSV